MWKEPFDFIHSAYLSQGIRDWPTYTQRIYDNLVPGGVVQLLEFSLRFSSDDNTVRKGGYLDRYEIAFEEAARIAGLHDASAHLHSYLQAAGFLGVKVVVKKLPIGPWPKDHKKKVIGRWGLSIAEQGCRSYGFALFTRHLGMPFEEASELCEGAFKELCQRDVHTYMAQ